MAIFDNDDEGIKLFGLNFFSKKKTDEADTKSASFSIPMDDDGSGLLAAASSAAYYGVYVDINGLTNNDSQMIMKCRDISLYPEVDVAIQDIVNEAIPHETDTPLVKLDLSSIDCSDTLKDKIQAEFKRVLTLLDYENDASDLFRRWYIDGRLNYHIIVDKENLKKGIQELRLIEATKIRKFKEIEKKKTPLGVDAITKINEFFIYNEQGFGPQPNNANTTSSQVNQSGVKISPDAIIYVPSGYVDNNTTNVMSYLQKAIRPANQLRMLEDATVVYFIARAPERRIFYVDVGNLPKAKAEQYVKELMNKYRNKMVYDAKSGEVKDDKKYMSMLEDFWMPRRDGGKGTSIETLPGASNISGQFDALEYFRKKLYEALNVPKSRLQEQSGFSLGRSTEVSRDEVKFQKFIDKLRRKFSQLFYEALRTQLILKGICNSDEWDQIYKENIEFRFQSDNFFNELKDLEILQARLAAIPQIDNYLQKYYSKKWVQKNVLHQTDEEIDKMAEEIADEADDPHAQPSWKEQMQAQMEMQQQMAPPGMPGDEQDPNAQEGQDPYAEDPNNPAAQGSFQ